ncbi:MAG: FkbM family methyltransferase [Bacteroidetes bacterium]|nr:FkbM family methyltransferase [Bacteroidota bacterium]
MKGFILRLLQSLVSKPWLFLKIKDTIFCSSAEHFFRLTKYAHTNYSHALHFPILDIGAANGESAAYLSKNFVNTPIIAYEPFLKMFHIAQKTNLGNKNVIIKNLALYDSIGKKELNITANFVSSSINELNAAEINEQPGEQKKKFELLEKQEINTSTLDEETKDLKEILLIKLDTQGSELNILKSGIETLKKTHLILIEMSNHHMYKKGCQYYEVDQFLRNNNFKLIDIIVVYRPEGVTMEYDAIYEKVK